MHFEASFMCWVLIGALGIAISKDLGLQPWAKGLAVGLPLVAGSVFRLVVGPLADKRGPRLVGAGTLVVTALALLLGWAAARSFAGLLGVGLLLGAAGSSFAVAIPMAGRAFEPRLRGLAMGIAGAGNSGTVVAAIVAPQLAMRVGWHGVMGLAVLPVFAVLVAFVALSANAPAPEPVIARPLRRVWTSSDARSLSVLYLVTFGGFVGMVSFLPILLKDTYGVGATWAATATAICAGAGSFLRPVGGHLADRFGGERVLPTIFFVASTAVIGVAGHPTPTAAVALLTVTVGALGAGNGAVFQIVPRRFPSDMGAITGLVGAAGGLGGFLLPFGLGVTKSWTGSYAAGLAVFAAASLCAAASLVPAVRRWRVAPVELAA
jgi:NNP family nitrate/nitrite transporter-like MFS transporter